MTMNDNSKKFKRRPDSLSGRAFSNGVLLMGGGAAVLSVKTKNGKIITEKYPQKIISGAKIKVPFLRGIVTILSAVVYGVKFSFRAFERNRRLSFIRLLKYHGAEHKTIHCYENGDELTIENLRRQPTYHPRCGTNVAVNALITELLFCLAIPGRVRNAVNGLLDVILLFTSVGVGYESSRYVLKHNGRLAKALSVPGRFAQKFTALEPDDDMLECAAMSALGVMKSEERL